MLCGKTESAYRNGHQLLDLLYLVSSCGGLQSFEDRHRLGHGQQPLFRSFGNNGCLRSFLRVRPSNNNLVVVVVILLEQSVLIIHTPGGDLHLCRILFSGPVDPLQVFIITVHRKPSDDVLIRPVNLQGPGMLVENVVLFTD